MSRGSLVQIVVQRLRDVAAADDQSLSNLVRGLVRLDLERHRAGEA